MTSNADFDPIVVDATLSEQTVRELFAVRRESWKLDYKAAFDPSSKADVVEITKDIVAMANTAGGYIVIGAADDGTPLGVPPAQLAALDESNLRKQVERYIGRSLPLFLNKAVSYEGQSIAIVTTLRSQSEFLVFEKDGKYIDPRSPSKKKEIIVFRPGDVFVRHGSASERWNQEDIDNIVIRLQQNVRRQVQSELAPVIERSITEPTLDHQDKLRLLLRSDEMTFERAIRRMLRDTNE